LRWINAAAERAGQGAAMIWIRKQSTARRLPAKESHEVVLSPCERGGQPAVAAWPTGLTHLWLRRAHSTIALPVRHRKSAVLHGGK
jgi:hypothetical protein